MVTIITTININMKSLTKMSSKEKKEDHEVIKIVERLRTNLTKRSHTKTKQDKKSIYDIIYEIRVSNINTGYEESWYHVDTADAKDWYVLPHEEILLEKYGWKTKIYHIIPSRL